MSMEQTKDCNVSLAEDTTVDGAIQAVSPMTKGKGKEYFHGTIQTESGDMMRFVGWNKKQHQAIQAYHDKNTTPVLDHCKVQLGKRSFRPEIILKEKTTILPSPKKIKNEDSKTEDNPIVNFTLNQLEETKLHTSINFRAKVLSLSPPFTINHLGKKKQEVIVADKTGQCEMTVWEDNINNLIQSKSYIFTNMNIYEFKGKRVINMEKHLSKFAEIPDIEDVISVETKPSTTIMENATVIAVLDLKDYRMCVSCKGKVDPYKDDMAICSKCLAQQKIDFCAKAQSARLLLKTAKGLRNVTIFTENLTKMVGGKNAEITREDILKSEPFNAIVSEGSEVIQDIFQTSSN